jgi:FLVCR family MFS transporter 7
MGQISGILFIYLFEVLQNTTGTIVWPMLLFVALTVIELPMTLKMKETYISAG